MGSCFHNLAEDTSWVFWAARCQLFLLTARGMHLINDREISAKVAAQQRGSLATNAGGMPTWQQHDDLDDAPDVRHGCVFLALSPKGVGKASFRDLFLNVGVPLASASDGLASVVCAMSGDGDGRIDHRNMWRVLACFPYLRDLIARQGCQLSRYVVWNRSHGVLKALAVLPSRSQPKANSTDQRAAPMVLDMSPRAGLAR